MRPSPLAVWLNRILITLLFIFLLAPVFPVIMMSFTNDPYIMFPPQTWGVEAYWNILQNRAFVAGAQNSLIIGVIVTVLALAVGIPAAYAIARLPLPGRDTLLALFTSPLIVPNIVFALGLLLVLVYFGLLGSYFGLIVAHTVLVVPFVIRILLTALNTMPAEVEAAASTLGATPVRVFMRITLPLLRPAILAAAGLSFLLSFDEVTVSLFIVGTSVNTLPVALFRYTQSHTDAQIAALSVVLILITIVIVLAVERTVGLMKGLGRH
ncbi:MAG: ABC transporter permease [Rhizobiaceae bacterium]|nr:ABC transporter permease [Rhizobiaceae bacterium]